MYFASLNPSCPPASAGTGIISGEVPLSGDSFLADRAAWALAEPPINAATSTAIGAIGPGAYTAAFGGVDSTGTETGNLAYFYPDSASWALQSQTGGAGAVPLARQAAAMAYLWNCSNSTPCFVMFGGAM